MRSPVVSGRVRSRMRGCVVLLHRADVEALAAELATEAREQAPPQQQLVKPGQFLDEIRRLHEELRASAFREGALRAQNEELRQRAAAQRLLTAATRPRTWRERLLGRATRRPDVGPDTGPDDQTDDRTR